MAGFFLPKEFKGRIVDWEVADPVFMDYAEHCEVRDTIETLVMKLVLELRAPRAHAIPRAGFGTAGTLRFVGQPIWCALSRVPAALSRATSAFYGIMETRDRMPSATESQPHVNPWIVAVAVMFATFMEVLDTTVVNVSLPHIAGSLSVSTDEAAWALTSYLVANAIILPMTGWIASYFGRKRTLLAAVFGFTAASFLCGLATSLPMLIFFRVVQGATGGALQPLSQAVMLEAFPRGTAAKRWRFGDLASWWPRCSGR